MKRMKQNHFLMRTLMALTIMFAVSTTASAQFGNLKGLAGKAKKAVQDKAKQQVNDAPKQATTTVTSTVTEQAQQATSSAVAQAAGSVGDVWQWENKHPEQYGRVDYSIAKQTEWTTESDVKDICADLAWNLLNSYKLENYLNVQRHYPAYKEVLQARLEGISGLGHAQGMSTLSDKVTDPVQKKLIDDWMGELSSLNGRFAAAYIPDQFDMFANAAEVYRDWKKSVGFIADEQTPMDKVEAFNIAYNRLEKGIMTNKISGKEGDFQQQFDALMAGYNILPSWAKKYYSDDMTFEGIKRQALERKADAVAIKRAGQEAHAKADKEVRKTTLLQMYKEAQAKGRYVTMPASKGSDIEKYAKRYAEQMMPEWGKVIRTSCKEDWKIVRDKLGNIKYRYCGVTILCEDQGYKVVHGFDVHEDYKGGSWGNPLVRNEKWNSLLDLVK